LSTPSITATTHYVLADGGDDCPAGNECHPLSYYTSHSDSYFTDNTVFYFLKGNHSMSEGVVIQGKSNITINGKGTSSSIITCTNPTNGGFTVSGCDSITISNLFIIECGMKKENQTCDAVYPIIFHFYLSIIIHNTWKINLHSLFIASSYIHGGALLIANGVEVFITNSSFESFRETINICYTPFSSHNISDKPVNVSMIDCNIRGSRYSGYTGLLLSLNHGKSYFLDVSLREITVLGLISTFPTYSNIKVYITQSSQYSIDIEKLTSFGGGKGLSIQSHPTDSSGVTLPSSVVITDSDFYNNRVGVF
jgi:hypothetical protein